MTIKYIAFDGKSFDDEDECVNYERELNCGTRLEGALFLGNHYEPIDFAKEGVDVIYHAHFTNTDQIKYFNEQCEYYGVQGIENYDEKEPLDFLYVMDNPNFEDGYYQYCQILRFYKDSYDSILKKQTDLFGGK